MQNTFDFSLIMNSMTALPVPPSVVAPPLSSLTRLNCAVRLWSFKFFVAAALSLFRTVKRGEVNTVKPTYTKRYQVRPMLENRVFIPKAWKAGTKLPVYIDIHGGGFALCDPQTGTDRGFNIEAHELIVTTR
jgi:acetyl esterase/lipase